MYNSNYDPTATINELVANVGQTQMAREHYVEIANTILSTPDVNILVYGTGHDSKLWIECARSVNSKVTFLEPSERWADVARQSFPDANVLGVEYFTKASEWNELFEQFEAEYNMLCLEYISCGFIQTDTLKTFPKMLKVAEANDVWNTEYDVVIVDSPIGSANGRMTSIVHALGVAMYSESCTVFVHDAQRQIEAFYINKFMRAFSMEDETLVAKGSPMLTRHKFC
jgi:hypothetical protein